METADVLNVVRMAWGIDARLLAIFIVSMAYLIIFTEKVNRAVIALLGAAAMIISGVLNQEQALKGIDFNTLALLIGMMIIVAISERSGIFQYVAIWGAKKVKANPRGLLMVLALVTAVFSGFLDNVTTVLLIVPVTFQITKKLEINPYPYLLMEIFASNIGGTATLIGDPPNILIGSALDLTFMDFVKNLTPVVTVVMIFLMVIFDFCWRKKLVASEKNKALVMAMDEKACITDKVLLFKSLFVLVAVVVSFVFARQIFLDNGTIALTGAAVLLLLYSINKTGSEREDKISQIFNSVDWTTIFFFVGLFVIVYGLEVTGVLGMLGQTFLDLTNGEIKKMVYFVLWSSAILSSAIDNIPFVATMIPMIKSIEESLGGREAIMPVWWALSLGACFGGNGTLIGASANVVVAGMAAKEGEHINFIKFLLWSIPVMLMSVGMASVFLYLRLMN